MESKRNNGLKSSGSLPLEKGNGRKGNIGGPDAICNVLFLLFKKKLEKI